MCVGLYIYIYIVEVCVCVCISLMTFPRVFYGREKLYMLFFHVQTPVLLSLPFFHFFEVMNVSVLYFRTVENRVR